LAWLDDLARSHKRPLMPPLAAPRRQAVRVLGALLGKIVSDQAGAAVYERVESVRGLAKRARSGDGEADKQLSEALAQLPVSDALPVARAFSLFLTLVNIADSHHRLRDLSVLRHAAWGSCREAFGKLLEQGITPEQLHQTVSGLGIELV